MTIEQTIFIVEDDAPLRDSLALLLGLSGYRTQSFECAEDFLRVYEQTSAGCLLLDIRMKGMSGLELQATLLQKQIKLPVIIMTAHGDISIVRTTLKSGAVDFLEKPVDPDELLASVRAALEIDASRWKVEREAEEANQKLARLTARERQVLDLLVKGSHNREIAESLGISPRTAEVHKSRVMEKLKVRTLSALVRIALNAPPLADHPESRK